MKSLDKTLIVQASKNFDLDPLLVAALILQESSGNPYAFRYERLFYRKYVFFRTVKELGGFFPQSSIEDLQELCIEREKILRSCSFGLSQIMGQVARELGFNGNDMFDLLQPEINLKYGLLKLNNEILLAREKYTSGSLAYVYEKALLRYNGGGDPNYGQVVLRKMQDNSAHNFLYE